MATLNSLAADAYTITNRPDLVAETLLSLRKAIRKYHGADTFKRDLAITRIDMTAQTPMMPNQYRWNLDLSLFAQLRRFKGVNYPTDLVPPYNQTPAPLVDWTLGSTRAREYHEVAPDNLFDSYGYERQNYFFVTGNTVTLKSGWYVDYLDFAYYQWPIVPTDPTATLASWIVNEYPDAVIEEASGAVFKMIGKDEEYQRFRDMFAENLAIIKATAVGETA